MTGAFDPATRSGSVTSNTPALRIDNNFAHSRAIIVGWFGMKIAGGGATVTGRIQRTRTIFAKAGPRRPLLRIKRLGFDSGPFQRRGKPVPDTFVIAMSGRATILPAFARELTRIRCRGPHITTSRPIRAGSPFGSVQLQLRPDAATGVGGSFDITSLAVRADNENDLPAIVTPTSIHVDLPGDLRTPLRCNASYDCVPVDGTQLALGSGFTVSLGDRAVTVAGLTAAFGELAGRTVVDISGIVDGAPMALMRDGAGSQAFQDYLSSARGAYSTDVFAKTVASHFAITEPP
jgi:hypothetical protein